MSTTIIKSMQPTIERLQILLEEVKRLDLTPLDQMLTREEICQQHEARKRIIQEKMMLLKLYLDTLEQANAEWKQYIQQVVSLSKRKEEEDKYSQMADDKKGMLNLINEGKEVMITLTMYKNDSELVLQRLAQGMRNESNHQSEIIQSANHPTINLPQISLPIFSGNIKLWREFWSNFETAVHLQNIPDIQKLNYLFVCLKAEALQAIRDYDITPENYDVIRNVLTQKFGQIQLIKKSLYNELHFIKRFEREWKVTVEAIERTL
ncbi:hypothetical protein ACH3XW_28240 [Acanthocheilonema viteae]